MLDSKTGIMDVGNKAAIVKWDWVGYLSPVLKEMVRRSGLISLYRGWIELAQ